LSAGLRKELCQYTGLEGFRTDGDAARERVAQVDKDDKGDRDHNRDRRRSKRVKPEIWRSDEHRIGDRDEDRYRDPDRFDVLRNPEHQAFGAGGRHFCLGTALARLELKILVEETLKRYPNMSIDSEPTWVLSQFSSQLKTLHVRLDS
jgi:hypothetical protein